MRLGQLARKLALRPVEIIDFLAMHHIQIEDGSNTKLEDQHIAMVLHKFSPSRTEEIMSVVNEKDNSWMGTEPVAATSTPDNENQGAEELSVVGTELTSQETRDQKVELIKAAKVELSGLKVLGKIDLQDPKKKEAPLPPDESSEKNLVDPGQKPKQDFRRIPQRRERPLQAPVKNPIALQREREAREAERKRQEDAERQKEKRSRHYHQKVKVAPPTKRVKMVEEPVGEFSAAEMVEPPKTWWGKFMRWLNT